MEVRVIKKQFGNYKEGDIIDMPDSTALACIKSGVVEAAEDTEKTEVKPNPKNKKKDV